MRLRLSDIALQPEELTTTDYLLKIFRVSIPHMPQTAGKFGHELQLALQPMIIKPSGNGGVQVGLISLTIRMEFKTRPDPARGRQLYVCRCATPHPRFHSLGQPLEILQRLVRT